MNFNTNFNYFSKYTSVFLPKSCTYYCPTISSHLFVFTCIVPFARVIAPISICENSQSFKAPQCAFEGRNPGLKVSSLKLILLFQLLFNYGNFNMPFNLPGFYHLIYKTKVFGR